MQQFKNHKWTFDIDRVVDVCERCGTERKFVSLPIYMGKYKKGLMYKYPNTKDWVFENRNCSEV